MSDQHDAVDATASPYVTYSERYGLVKLPLWVIDNLTNPGASMYDEKVERIWFAIVEACKDAREVGQ